MDDEDIRRALRELGDMKLGVRAGHVRVMREDLAHHGIDFDEAPRWLKARGGDAERVERRRTGLGSNYGKLDVFVSLIVPTDALGG